MKRFIKNIKMEQIKEGYQSVKCALRMIPLWVKVSIFRSKPVWANHNNNPVIHF